MTITSRETLVARLLAAWKGLHDADTEARVRACVAQMTDERVAQLVPQLSGTP